MNWYFKAITQWPKLTLTIMLIVTILFGLGLPKLKIRNNADSELPQTDPIVLTKNKIDSIFGKKSAVLVGIKTDDVYKTSTLQKIADLSRELESVPKVIPNEITSLSTVKNVVGNEEGLAVGTLMKKIPRTQAEIETLKAMVEKNDMIRGTLVSKDHTFTAIIANLEDGADQGTIHRKVYEIIGKYQGPETIYASGEKIFSEEIDSGVQRDSNVLTPISLLIIMGILFFFFRSIRGVALPWLAIVLSIIWSLGFMGHIGMMQSVVSSMLPALLVITGGAFGVHIMLHYYAETAVNPAISAQEAAYASIVHVIRPLVLAGVTSALGTLSLVVFDVLSIREFGLIFALATLFSLFLCITIMPSILAIQKVQVRRVDALKGTGWLNLALESMTRLTLRRPGAVLAAFVLIVVVSVIGITRIKTGLDVASLFPPDHRGKISLDVFGENLGGVRALNIMIEAPESGGIKNPVYLNKIVEFQRYIQSQPGVGHATSFADVVMQVAKSLHPEWGDVGRVPATQEEVAQFLFLYDISGTPGDFANLIDYDYRRARIQVTLSTSNPDDHKRLYQLSRDYWDKNIPAGGKAEFGGDTLFWIAQSDYVVKGKIANVLSNLPMIFLFVALVYRSFTAGLFSLIPVTVGGLITFGVMGFAGIRLDIAAACISGVVAGIGVDFSLHYLDSIRTLGRTTPNIGRACMATQKMAGRSICYDALATVLGFLAITISGFVIVKNFGYLLALSMVSTTVSVLLLLPVLLMLVKPGFISREPSFWHRDKTCPEGDLLSEPTVTVVN